MLANFSNTGSKNLTDLLWPLRSAVYKRRSYENLFVTRKWRERRENLESLEIGGRKLSPDKCTSGWKFPNSSHTFPGCAHIIESTFSLIVPPPPHFLNVLFDPCSNSCSNIFQIVYFFFFLFDRNTTLCRFKRNTNPRLDDYSTRFRCIEQQFSNFEAISFRNNISGKERKFYSSTCLGTDRIDSRHETVSIDRFSHGWIGRALIYGCVSGQYAFRDATNVFCATNFLWFSIFSFSNSNKTLFFFSRSRENKLEERFISLL